jgi:predicted acetyltransferase
VRWNPLAALVHGLVPASRDDRVGPLAPDTSDALRDLEAISFHFSYQDEEWARESNALEVDWSEVAREGGHVVGHTSAYSMQLAVPGAAATPVAGVTWVSVALTHRRRGVLRELMLRQLAGLHEQQREPVAALWASEAAIYGRFGYGLRRVRPRWPAAATRRAA